MYDHSSLNERTSKIKHGGSIKYRIGNAPANGTSFYRIQTSKSLYSFVTSCPASTGGKEKKQGLQEVAFPGTVTR